MTAKYTFPVALCLLLFSQTLFAQNAWQVIASSGGSGSCANQAISFTVGQHFTGSAECGGVAFLQGFQQPPHDFGVATDNPLDETLVTLFPNPASQSVTLRWSGSPPPCRFAVFDLLGRQATPWQATGGASDYVISLQNLPSGTYFLLLRHEQARHLLVFEKI